MWVAGCQGCSPTAHITTEMEMPSKKVEEMNKSLKDTQENQDKTRKSNQTCKENSLRLEK